MAITEHNAGPISDLADGGLKEVTLGKSKILLIRRGNEVSAIGALCPHYGASLAKGILCHGRVICPWHKSAFSVNDGAVLEPPSLDGVPRYEVRMDGSDILVAVPDEPADRVTVPPLKRGVTDSKLFVILGGGTAGEMAAETLRNETAFAGQVVMIDAEGRLPYDRTQLSKGYLKGKVEPLALPLRNAEYFEEREVERRHARATAVDAAAKTVTLDDGSTIHYDALLFAPGGVPKKLGVPGEGASNVFTLRNVADADRIAAEAKAAGGLVMSGHAVVIGDGFIGLESASVLIGRGLKVTVVSPDAVPFKDVLGEEVGKFLKSFHEGKGVTFVQAKTAKFQADPKQPAKAAAAVMQDGTTLEADLFLVGLGVTPGTEGLTGVELRKDGGVPVDATLKATDGLWAAGDVAAFPYRDAGPVRVEHWRVAEQHGKIAALNMAGAAVEFDAVPYFWTEHYQTRLDYVGHADGFDEVIADGDIAGGEFIAYYVKSGKVVAASARKRDKQASAFLELMRLGQVPTADELRAGPDLTARLG